MAARARIVLLPQWRPELPDRREGRREPVRRTELANAAVLSGSRMTRGVDDLRARDLVTKRTSAKDARGNVTRLTPEGLARLRKVWDSRRRPQALGPGSPGGAPGQRSPSGRNSPQARDRTRGPHGREGHSFSAVFRLRGHPAGTEPNGNRISAAVSHRSVARLISDTGQPPRRTDEHPRPPRGQREPDRGAPEAGTLARRSPRRLCPPCRRADALCRGGRRTTGRPVARLSRVLVRLAVADPSARRRGIPRRRSRHAGLQPVVTANG